MKRSIVLLAAFLALGTSAVHASALAPGLYMDGSRRMYVGVESEAPDPAVNQYFDPRTQRTGDLDSPVHWRLLRGIEEERRHVRTTSGLLGVSLYYAGNDKRATVVLIHGNDAETREMGFLIPYFVLNGVNVISYDQRGTGESAGDWQRNGPAQRADDVERIFDAFTRDRHVDVKRVGLWAFSNGGWTAPIVATKRPVAFMLLKSAPAESLQENLLYEVRESMAHHGFAGAPTDRALHAWRLMLNALAGTGGWNDAAAAYANAERAPWAAASLFPPNLSFPLSRRAADGYRRELFYDPAPVLHRVRVPTLALYGALDRNVDVAHDEPLLRAAFTAAGMRDLTIQVYPHAGHTLIVSTTGYNGEASKPVRFVQSYPAVMIRWLAARGFRY